MKFNINIAYEIDIVNIEDNSILNTKTFGEWLTELPQYLGIGKHTEYYPISKDVDDDIKVIINIKKKNDE